MNLKHELYPSKPLLCSTQSFILGYTSKPLQEPRRGQHCQNLVLGGASSSDALCVREWCSLNA